MVPNHQPVIYHNILYHLILVGGAITILKILKVNGKDDIPYMENKIHV